MVYAWVILFGKHSTSYCIHNWSWHVIIIKITHRTNCPEVFCKKVVLRKIAKFTAKHLCLRPATLLKKRLWHRCFPVNFAKFLRTTFFIDHLWWLLVNFFTESHPKRNGNAQNVQHSQKPYFFSMDFLVVIIYQNFLFVYMQKYSFYLCYSPAVFTPFHYFFCFTPL